MGSGKENKTKFKKNSLFKNRKGDFSLRVRAEPYYHILLLLTSQNNAITRAQREKDIRA